MTALLMMLLAAEPVDLSAAERSRAIESFKVRGTWIQPDVVETFLPWLSDHDRPIIRSIDLAAALETNRFVADVKQHASGASVDRGDQGFVEYEWLGRTQGGLHVLLIRLATGGSGVFSSLGVFRLADAESVDASGKPYRSLMLSIVRWVSLGDRVTPKLVIKGNVVSGRVECTLPSCTATMLRLSL